MCLVTGSLRYEGAGELGFEPRQADPESAVLPLHHSPFGFLNDTNAPRKSKVGGNCFPPTRKSGSSKPLEQAFDGAAVAAGDGEGAADRVADLAARGDAQGAVGRREHVADADRVAIDGHAVLVG